MVVKLSSVRPSGPRTPIAAYLAPITSTAISTTRWSTPSSDSSEVRSVPAVTSRSSRHCGVFGVGEAVGMTQVYARQETFGTSSSFLHAQEAILLSSKETPCNCGTSW
jgi:hypothetical protein